MPAFSHSEYDDFGREQSSWGNGTQRALDIEQSEEPAGLVTAVLSCCLGDAITTVLMSEKRTFQGGRHRSWGPIKRTAEIWFGMARSRREKQRWTGITGCKLTLH